MARYAEIHRLGTKSGPNLAYRTFNTLTTFKSENMKPSVVKRGT